jgi:uncharacterized metal-binding protein
MSIKVHKPEDFQFHTRATTWIADIFLFLVGSVMVAFGGNPIAWTMRLFVALIGAHLASQFLTPDLDLYHSGARRNWGPIGWLFEPYRRLIAKKHRGTLSHGIKPPKRYGVYGTVVFNLFGFMLGTFVRTAYLVSLVGLVSLAFSWITGINIMPWMSKVGLSEFALWLFVGTLISDCIHVQVVDRYMSRV